MTIESVCVFLGSARGEHPRYVLAARDLGERLARSRRRLVYGGASVGLMGELADAALAAGGEVIGVIPSDMVTRELAHPRLTQLEIVASMAERKDRMFMRSDAFITLSGGFGTLDELFEALTAGLLGHHRKPMILVDTDGYYAGLLGFIDHAVAAGFIRAEHRALLEVVATPEAALARLAGRSA